MTYATGAVTRNDIEFDVFIRAERIANQPVLSFLSSPPPFFVSLFERIMEFMRARINAAIKSWLLLHLGLHLALYYE
jgi:hypothetical protein